MFPILAGSNPSGYNLTRSLRFRKSASAYLSRTPATTSGNQIFTMSAWVKRGQLGVVQTFMFAFANTNLADGSSFMSDDTLEVSFYNGGPGYSLYLKTTQVFRDPSAWYHIVLAVDTTQATSTNRFKLYVNGLQVTAFSSTTYPVQNLTFAVNSNCVHTWGVGNYTALDNYSDFYTAELNWVTGQQLTPSSFGSTNTLTGVWQPARYTGTYGTNGFYLPFTDNSALTTSSNVGLGKDFSGNGNYWTTNNISITAGVTYDSMTDVPTLTSATAANFAVMNPLEHPTTFVAPTNGNLTQNCNTSAWTLCVPTINIPNGSGLWQWEFVQTGTANGANAFGVCLSTVSATTTGDPSSRAGCSGVSNASGAFINGSTSGSITYPTTSTTVTCLYDATNRTFQVFENGTSKGTITGLPSGDVRAFVAASSSNGSPTFDMNFGQRPFGYDKGGKALNAFNLPDSTIVKGNTVMDATLFTANSSGGSVTNAAGFKPDFVWSKTRDISQNHFLIDSVRGGDRLLYSNLTNAEATNANLITSFNSNGFTYGNALFSANSYVGWQWQAGQGSTSTNTNGTITSTVSVNASAGFSVVTYTGTNVSGATIGHGLGVAPSLIIIKNRTSVEAWPVYHRSVGATKYLVLNTTAAEATSSTPWNNTAPTSTVFSLGNWNALNENGSNHVAYCWTPIAGYSAFGSYTGNGNADGPFVYLGFRPKFVLYKDTANGSTNWELVDSARNTYNPEFTRLFPNATNADDNAVNPVMDFTANGFKIRTSAFGVNNNGNVHIYMAFAENPFKNALAR